MQRVRPQYRRKHWLNTAVECQICGVRHLAINTIRMCWLVLPLYVTEMGYPHIWACMGAGASTINHLSAKTMDPNFLRRSGVKWGTGVGGSIVSSRGKYEPVPDVPDEAGEDDAFQNERRPLFLAQSSSAIEDGKPKDKRGLYWIGIGSIAVVISSFVLMRTVTSPAPSFIAPGDASWLCKDDMQSNTAKTTKNDNTCAPGDGTP